jgi:poly(hydroxyalkanoate) depolymerase family esterase
MYSFDAFAPANSFLSLMKYAFLSPGAQLCQSTDPAVTVHADQWQNTPGGADVAGPIASDAVSDIDEVPTLPAAKHASPEATLPQEESPQWFSQCFEVDGTPQMFKIFIPSSYRSQSLPLIVMLHGAHQAPDDFSAGTGMNAVAEEEGYIVVYPEQAESANLLRCWNWFRPKDRARECGETAAIAALTREVMATYNVDDARVYVAGMSAGGAMAVNLAVTHPDLFAAVAIHSGVAFGVADEHVSALCAMNDGKGKIRLPGAIVEAKNRRAVPLIIFHGDADDTVHPRNSDQIVAMGRMLHGDFEPIERTGSAHIDAAAGQYAYSRTVFRDQCGSVAVEQWLVHGLGHAWSGGHPHGSYTDSSGPCASKEAVRFFKQVHEECMSRRDGIDAFELTD